MAIDLSTLQNKEQEAKIYAVVFREEKSQVLELLIRVAYSLEEIYAEFTNAKNSRLNRLIEEWRPYLWMGIPVKTLFQAGGGTIEMDKDLSLTTREMIPHEVNRVQATPERKRRTQEEIKNHLMKVIIETKNVRLFNRNIKRFNENEVQYIKNKLAI